MNPSVFKKFVSKKNGREGIALVLVLVILVILSILLVSFVSMSSLDRGATKNYGGSLQAEQIAQGGLDQIVSQFQAEIADPQLSTNYPSVVGGGTNNLYIPISGSSAMPQRTALSSTNFATLISYSGTSLYTSGSGATDYSSNSLTTGTSMNGRYITPARWNKPQLTTGTSGFPVPKWVLMTRAGPQATGSYNSSLANNNINSGSYVVGRYAYVVYDTSGLLDANVAGYPSTSSTNASGKGLLPWADLTQIITSGTPQSVMDGLVNWRNAATSGSYAANVYTSATSNGFTRVASGDTLFLGRQELIKYAQTQNPDLVSALPYLTTFSRELNGPTWGPAGAGLPTTGTYAYVANEYTVGALNPRIPNPRVLAAFTRNNGLQAVPGEPLVKYRFPLGKLSLLEKFIGTGTGTLTATDITDIQKYFGLDLAGDANGPSYRHWTYPTANPAYRHGVLSGATGIMTLDDVAPQNREPDFFELLQAGILAGSLGAPGKNSSGYPNAGRSDKYPVTGGNGPQPPSYVDPDDSTTLQALRIGANIIDQADADSFPTTITYTPSASSGGQPISVEGIEDLPYPFAAYLNIYSSSGTTTGASSIPTGVAPFNFYLYFELWNPHQTPASTGGTYPTNFRFSPYYNSSLQQNSDSFVAGFANSRTIANPGASESWFYNGTLFTPNGAQGTHVPYYMATVAGSSGIPFSYSPTAATNNYREPALAVGAPVPTASVVPSPWSGIACLVLPPLTSFPSPGKKANNDGSGTFPANASGPSGPNGAWQCQYDLKMVMPVQYQDAAGSWHTYSTFIGMDDPNGAYPAETCYDSNFGWAPVNLTASLACSSLVKSDPRTFRFGVGYGSGTGTLATSGSMNTPVTSAAPFGAAANGTAPYRLDMWVSNDSSISPVGPASANSYYSDVDGVQRWGDSRNTYQLSGSSNPLFSSPLFTGDTNNRPVILNRPFRSVGELGYAFRDMPWKTLDLFSANSADSGLLDLFTVSDAPVVAGRVNPNTPYPQVLTALISGAAQSAGGTTVSTANARLIAQAMQSITSGNVFVNRANIVNNFMTNSSVINMASTGIKTEEEAVVRALAESSNTRTWNFMIDIIAQAGRYPSAAGTLDNFVVEGERRYWLHVAIDRYTGQVVDKQLEVVNE